MTTRQAALRRSSTRRSTAHVRQWVNSFKAVLGCRSCGLKDHRALEFHHRDRTHKVAAVSVLVARGEPLAIVVREIDKCDVLCANCHRIKHHCPIPGDPPLLTRVIHPVTEEVFE